MGTAKITNALLAIIAVLLIWMAIRPNDVARVDTAPMVRAAAAQTKTAAEQDQPLEAICTLSRVEQAAAKSLVGDLQSDVIAALNQTNAALQDLQTPLAAMQQLLRRAETELKTISNNTRSY